ncbi:NACHT domain-containing protein [Fusarium denticulatum]|uniref:NACHT domain-containing protein n=1 Tax=Fusarium denticulatum TaxID=48507 RepID=A0A8H5SYG8_9HYPO|nr:NACHT domain-containing protein [Fusarium denticulatum]
MSTSTPAQQALEQAQQRFRSKVESPSIYDEILIAGTIEEVYKLTNDIQSKLAPQGKLRHLAKIKPFLDRLSEYASVIEVFIQAKPDILALIWGPIKIILHWSSQISSVLDKVADILETVGYALPHFARMAQTFNASDAVMSALTLYYEDILDLYAIFFHFFRKTRWKQFFEVLWPNCLKKIDPVIKSLEKHSLLMKNEVTFIDIQEAREARARTSEQLSRAEASQQLQRFRSLRSRVSPDLYDSRLDWFRNRCVSGCATWLLKDGEFGEWMDPNSNNTTYIWLQGIPGAGKTYLSAAAIDHTREHHQTLFAFISHGMKSSQSALSILHSLVFQAAEDDQSFQAHLLDSKERELQGNTSFVLELLKTFLTTAGRTHIIIDGLDEMDEYERQILLKRFDELSKDCSDLRLMISSRAEDDIATTLKDKATAIRVDHRNSGSIQTYIDQRWERWLANQGFATAVRRELFQSVAPILAKANGMFLYARIILDNLEQMNTIEEIRDELRALPNDLEGAYHRIFHRINTLDDTLRSKCRRLLGWIGCAPLAMTVPEMEQALAVKFHARGNGKHVPTIINKFNFIKTCGPIIEVVEEKLQFVHFTVHEYLFSSTVSESIDKDFSTKELAKTIISYLNLTLIDADLELDEIRGNILVGKYRLFEYGCHYWPTLVHQSIGRDYPPSLVRLLDIMFLQGKNYSFIHPIDESGPPFKCAKLQEDFPEVFFMFFDTLRFYLNDKRLDWNWGNSDKWINLNPLTTSHMLLRIQQEHASLVDSGDNLKVSLLRSNYGSNLFRCTHAFCEHSFRGFKTPGELSEHTKNHGKPWKCFSPNCDFSTIGFSTKPRRDEHWLKVHLPAPEELQKGASDFDKMDVIELQRFLPALVIEGDVDGVQRLLASPGGKNLKPECIESARRLAAKIGSLVLTQLLVPIDQPDTPESIIKLAIQSQDVDFAKWAIPQTEPEDCVNMMKVALSNKSEEIYILWEDYLTTLPPIVKPGPGYKERVTLEFIFNRTLFTAIKNNPMKEARVKHTLGMLGNRLSIHSLGVLLTSVAKSSCSLPLAKELIALGASIEFPRDEKGTGLTALHLASKNTSREAALLMRYLILKGAAIELNASPFSVIWLGKGAKEMAKWVGMTWEELHDQYLSSLPEHERK